MAEIICGHGRDHAYSCCPEHGTHKMRSLGGHTHGCPERDDAPTEHRLGGKDGLEWLKRELEELRDVAEESRREADAKGNWTASASYNGEWLGLTHALERLDELEERTHDQG